MSLRYAGGVEVAEVVRSGFVEGRHLGSVALLDATGRLVARAGDVAGPIFPRSSNKPMQATGMLRSGLRLTDPADLAMISASHSGEPFHVDRVRALLASAGLSEADLGCPAELPSSESALARLYRDGGAPASVLMNCSGKHAGMLLTCRAAGWPIDGYLDPGHPLQQACAAAVAEFAGEPVAAVGVDGCGAPVLAISLVGLASAFLRIVNAEVGTPQRAIGDAMRAFPELVSGTGATDARMMRAVPGLLTKGGAEGVAAAAIPGVGAVAVKIDDGNARARTPVLLASLQWLGAPISELSDLVESALLGGGRVVGGVRSTLALTRVLAR